MANDLEQKVSELVDGELDSQQREQLYKDLKHDKDMQHLWGRYCTISDALKKNLPHDPSHSLFNRVSQALESEPALLIPAAHTASEETQKPNIESTPPAIASIWPKYGMAAAVALFAVVGVVNMNSEQMNMVDSDSLVADKQTTLPTTINTNSQTVLVTSTPANQVSPPQVIPDDAQWERLPQPGIKLERYLLEHSESSSENSIQRGMIPYARVVSFGENGQQQ